MTPEQVIEALGLPREALVGQRVPKTLLVENGAPTAADKRLINDGVEELRWVAALKPNTVGVAPYRDDTREVVEVAVLTLQVRPDSKLSRLVELVHRAIPYHLLLVASEPADEPALSLADKRWSQNEGGRVVLDGDLVQTDLGGLTAEVCSKLLLALALARQPRATLYTVYRGWMNAIIAAEAARLTGAFALAESPERANERCEALRTCAALESTMASVRSAAVKEKQLARQVELNLELRRLQAQHGTEAAKLTQGLASESRST